MIGEAVTADDRADEDHSVDEFGCASVKSIVSAPPWELPTRNARLIFRWRSSVKRSSVS